MLLVKLLNLLLLRCILITARKPAYFAWLTFEAKPGDKETLADFSNITLKLSEEDTYINYLYGDFTFEEDFGSEFREYITLKSLEKIVYSNTSVCDDSFHNLNLLPLTSGRGEYNKTEMCPVKAASFHLGEIKDLSELKAPTDLSQDTYHIDLKFVKPDGSNIGGFEGLFYCIPNDD